MKTFEQWRDGIVRTNDESQSVLLEGIFAEHGEYMKMAWEACLREQQKPSPLINKCAWCGKDKDCRYFHCSLECADAALASVKDIA